LCTKNKTNQMEDKKKGTSFRVEPKLKPCLEMVCESERRSLNFIVNEALEYYFKNKHPEIWGKVK